MSNRNPVARDLRTLKYRKRIVRPRKGKGSYRREEKMKGEKDAQPV